MYEKKDNETLIKNKQIKEVNYEKINNNIYCPCDDIGLG
jgi:hypothetical protein